MQLGLIGYPLSHSFSKGYFGEKFEHLGLSATHSYENFPLPGIDDFPLLLERQPNLKGLNVTIPYKQAVIPFLNELSPGASSIGAVNTIVFTEGKRIGYNTDVIGFGDTLKEFLANTGGPSKGALILGTGGAAKAVAWVLEQQLIPFHYVSRRSRKGVLTYEELSEERMAGIDLIINTTPLGTSPAIDTFPNIPYHCLQPQHRLYDLVYNPEETRFLAQGKAQGAATMNGLPMLHAQAEAAWNIWNAVRE
ncbi:MAG: shikimate dehydrogenase [Bacteroidota bacterium]